jgi:hypothetical protein
MQGSRVSNSRQAVILELGNWAMCQQLTVQWRELVTECYTGLVGKSERKRAFERPRCRYLDNIRKDLIGIE